MYPNLNPNPMQGMNFPTRQLVNSAPTQSPFQANMSAQSQHNPQQPQQNFKRGGRVKNSYVAAHFSKKELDALDHLQGGSERHNKTGIRSYKGLEALLKNPHLLKLIHEHSASHHAEGGSIQGMAHNGRHGDTEMAFIGPHTRQLLDKLAGHKTRNPYDGHPEYFSLGKMLGGIGKTIMRVPKGIIKGVSRIGKTFGNLSPTARGMLGTAASAAALPIMGPAAAALPFIANAAPDFLKHIRGFAGKAKSSVNDLKNQANSMLGQAQEYGQNMYGKAQDKAQGMYDQGINRARDMYDQAINYGQQAQNEAQNMYGRAQEYGQNMYGKAQDKAQGMYDQGINRARDMYDQGINYGQQAQNEAQNMYGRAQEYGQNMYNQGQQAYGNARNKAKGYGQDIYNQAQGMGNQYALQGRQMYNQGRDQMNQMGQQTKEMYNQFQQLQQQPFYEPYQSQYQSYQPSYQPYSYYQ